MESELLPIAAVLLWVAGSPALQPPGGSLSPPRLFSTVFYMSFHLRAASSVFSFSIGWCRKRFEDTPGEDQKAFCVIGGCDRGVPRLPLLFDFPFPVFCFAKCRQWDSSVPLPF